jgi:hypothetical protein
MTDQQAYAAMFHFLEERYKSLPSDALGGLLGDMSLLADKQPADPAISAAWQRAVEYALEGGEAGYLKLG